MKNKNNIIALAITLVICAAIYGISGIQPLTHADIYSANAPLIEDSVIMEQEYIPEIDSTLQTIYTSWFVSNETEPIGLIKQQTSCTFGVKSLVIDSINYEFDKLIKVQDEILQWTYYRTNQQGDQEVAIITRSYGHWTILLFSKDSDTSWCYTTDPVEAKNYREYFKRTPSR